MYEEWWFLISRIFHRCHRHHYQFAAQQSDVVARQPASFSSDYTTILRHQKWIGFELKAIDRICIFRNTQLKQNRQKSASKTCQNVYQNLQWQQQNPSQFFTICIMKWITNGINLTLAETRAMQISWRTKAWFLHHNIFAVLYRQEHATKKKPTKYGKEGTRRELLVGKRRNKCGRESRIVTGLCAISIFELPSACMNITTIAHAHKHK